MEIPVKIAKEKTDTFLEYLNLAIRSSASGGYSSADSLPDGTYIETMRFALKVRELLHPVVWTITIRPDRTLAPIGIACEKPAPRGWQRAAEAVVRDALCSAVSEHKTRIFLRQEFAYYGPPLDGEYYILDFRIAPSRPVSGMPMGMGEEVLFLDQNCEGVGGNMAAAIGQVRAAQLGSLLSVFLNVGLHKIPIEHHWVYDSDSTCRHVQLGYRTSLGRPRSMPGKGVECNPGEYYTVDRGTVEQEPRHYTEPLRCPSDIVRLFRIYRKLPADKVKAFLGASTLFKMAITLGRHYPSVEMAYAIAAVDALNVGGEHSTDEFASLVAKYCPVAVDEIKRLYGKIRSAHFHSGRLPGGEYEPDDLGRLILMQLDMTERTYERWRIRALMRHVLVKWLLDQAGPKSNRRPTQQTTRGS